MATSQLLILGNGFDLHCGLKSSYFDFFQSTILDTISERFGIIGTKLDKPFYFWENLLLEYYRQYGRIHYNWCDIEQIIKDTVFFICNNNLTIPQEDPIKRYIVNSCNNFFHRYGKQNSHDNKCFLYTPLLKELQIFEKRFCEYLKSYIINPNNIEEFNEEYIINAMDLLASLTNFTYVKFNSIDTIINYKEELQHIRKLYDLDEDLIDVKPELFDVFDNLHSTYILSFNYTSLFDILHVKSPCVYNNVHGKLCMNKCDNNCHSSNIIFGIDDTLIHSEDETSDLRIFSKTYRKILNAETQTKILPPCDNNCTIEIKFYGHSLSEADYSYFQSIFDYYNLYDNINVSLIFYYSTGYEQTDAIYNLINSYGKTLANKNQGKNLMHKLLLENRLKIIKLD